MIPIPPEHICDVPIIGGGCTVLQGPSGWFEDMITAAAGAVFGFAMSLMAWIWNLITDTTTPHTDAGFVYEWAGRVFGIALPITVAFLIIQVITVMLRNRSTAGLGKSVALAGTAVLGTAASVPIIHLLTTAVDGVSHDLTAITFGDLDGVGDRFTEILSTVLKAADSVPGMEGTNYTVLGGGSVVAGAFGFIVFGAFLVFGSLAVFAALLVRTMLLDIAVVLGPLAIMGLAWEKTHGWFKKWVSLVVALIFTKLAVMIVFGLGVSGLESLAFSEDGPGVVGVLLTSTLMLFIAALVPVACFKFMSFIGDEIEAGSLHGAGTAAASRGREVAGRANPAQIMTAKNPMSAGRSGGGGGGGGSTAAGAGGGTRSAPQPTPTGGGAAGGGNSAGGDGTESTGSARDDAASSPSATPKRAAAGTLTAGSPPQNASSTAGDAPGAGGDPGKPPPPAAPHPPQSVPPPGQPQRGTRPPGPATAAPSAQRSSPDLTRPNESGGGT